PVNRHDLDALAAWHPGLRARGGKRALEGGRIIEVAAASEAREGHEELQRPRPVLLAVEAIRAAEYRPRLLDPPGESRARTPGKCGRKTVLEMIEPSPRVGGDTSERRIVMQQLPDGAL